MKGQRLFLLVVSICLALAMVSLAVGCAAPATTPTPTTSPTTKPATTPTPTTSPTAKPTTTPTPTEAAWPKHVGIGSSNVGSTTYILGVKMADMLTKYVKVPSTAEATVGSAEAVNLVAAGQLQLGFSTPDVVQDAYLGQGTYAGKKQPVRTLFGTYDTIMHQVIRASLQAKTVADFKGKKVFYTFPGSPSSKLYGEALFERFGFTPNDITVIKASTPAEGCTNIKDGVADAVIFWGGLYASYYVELAYAVPVTFVGLTKEDQDWLQNKIPWLAKEVIPGGVYKGQNNTLLAMGQVYTLVAPQDLPDSLGYEITKQFWDHLSEFKDVHATAQLYSLEKAVGISSAPYNAGAIKYFKEKGVWGAAQDTRQQALLKQTGQAK